MKGLLYYSTVSDTGKISVPRRMEQEVGEKFRGQRIETILIELSNFEQ